MVSTAARVRVTTSATQVSTAFSKDTTGVCYSDDKHSDGTSILPWRCNQVLVWNMTCPDTFAPSHAGLAFGEAGLVAAQVGQQKS